MTTGILRNWGGAVAISLPKKILALLGLKAGAEVQIQIEDGKIMLSPIGIPLTLAQLENEQSELERQIGGRLVEERWLDDPPRGRELL